MDKKKVSRNVGGNMVVPENYTPSGLLDFGGLNTKVNYDDMVQDALYFFPNPDNTSLKNMEIPTPNNYVIPEDFTHKAYGVLEIMKHMSDTKTMAGIFEDEYKYYYDEEYKKILVDQAVSAIVTNATSILYNGVLGCLRTVMPEYQYRYVYTLNHYDIQRVITDFMDTNSLMDFKDRSEYKVGEFDLIATLTVLGSEISREITMSISDYIRMILSDPKFHIATFIRRMCDRKLSGIFEQLDDQTINALVTKDCATDYMFAFGCLQDFLNEDIFRIQEIIEINLNFLFHKLMEYSMS